ncbi:MAG: AmmeMemoRadiSam system protein B [Acidobacteria bacterium]|jgi:AmmeMemoRadiSam system protein B|nr:AmmeMemoRadiSam system protein B [Acidobacteriota bacterium]
MKKSILLAGLALFSNVWGQDVRPVRDDIGFCWQRPQMERLMAMLDETEPEPPAMGGLVAAISPHDDYLYAGRVYYPLFKNLRAKEAVIFGVTHGSVRREIGDPQGVLILDDFAGWTGLGGPVAISPLRERIKKALAKDDFIVSNQAHALEHSIEALVPWLQFSNPDIRVTPIMVTAMPFERMEVLAQRLAEVLAGYLRENRLQLGRDIVFLVSADANHYGRDFANIPFGEDEKAHARGIEQDQRLAGELAAGTLTDEKISKLTRELWGDTHLDYRSTAWCGKYDIPFALLAIRRTVLKATARGLKGELLRYSDTYSGGVLPLQKPGCGITAPFSLKHWVGFFSAAFRLE